MMRMLALDFQYTVLERVVLTQLLYLQRYFIIRIADCLSLYRDNWH
jgi:hypothetical protein